MAAKTYDTKCYDLAKHFLDDMDCGDRKAEAIDRLAREIQGVIEDNIDTMKWIGIIKERVA